jgi:hypothetical protein
MGGCSQTVKKNRPTVCKSEIKQRLYKILTGFFVSLYFPQWGFAEAVVELVQSFKQDWEYNVKV